MTARVESRKRRGALTGNDKLCNKGKKDQAVGQVKEAAEKVVGKVAKPMGE